MGENAAAVRADLAQELRDALDQATLCAQHLPVDVGDLAFPDRYSNNPLAVVVDRHAELVVRDRHRTHALGRLLGSGRVMRQQRCCDAALRLRQRRGQHRIGTIGHSLVELRA